MKAKKTTARNAALPAYSEVKDKLKGEYIKGPEAVAKFNALAQRVFSISHEEMIRREEEYQRQAALNPNRRGPKPTVKRRGVKPKDRT